MKERRKIFSAADVAAIRDGRKTMFREMVVPQPPSEIEYPPEGRDGWFCSAVLGAKDYGHGIEWTVGASWGSQPCPKRWLHLLPKLTPPLGIVGDRIWIPEAHQFLRETCSYECEEYDLFEWEHDLYGSPKDHLLAKCPRGGHRAVIGYADEDDMEDWEMRPSVTMPRWACRTFAEITAVRVERVQDMEGMNAADSDALKEGVNRIHHEGGNYYYSAFRNHPHPQNWTDPFLAFKELWQSIYGNWDANPWVWVYEFRRVKP